MMERKGHSGFSLIEVVLTFSILAIASVALGLTEFSNARRTQELTQRDIAFGRGQAIMERVSRVPFGAPGALPATAEQLDMLFGTDEDVRTVSLTQLQQRDLDGDGVVDVEPFRFVLEGVEDSGAWEIFIDADLDGNGTIEPVIDGMDTREGRSDILRLEVKRDGKTVIKTIRARTPEEQDATEDILGEEPPTQTLRSVPEARDYVNGLANANKGTATGDKLEDVGSKLDTAAAEVAKGDTSAAQGAIDGAIGDVQAAIDAKLLDPSLGYDLISQLQDLSQSL